MSFDSLGNACNRRIAGFHGACLPTWRPCPLLSNVFFWKFVEIYGRKDIIHDDDKGTNEQRSERMNEQSYNYTNKQANARTNQHTNEDERKYQRTHERKRMHARTSERTTHGRTSERKYQRTHENEYTQERANAQHTDEQANARTYEHRSERKRSRTHERTNECAHPTYEQTNPTRAYSDAHETINRTHTNGWFLFLHRKTKCTNISSVKQIYFENIFISYTTHNNDLITDKHLETYMLKETGIYDMQFMNSIT